MIKKLKSFSQNEEIYSNVKDSINALVSSGLIDSKAHLKAAKPVDKPEAALGVDLSSMVEAYYDMIADHVSFFT